MRDKEWEILVYTTTAAAAAALNYHCNDYDVYH